MTSAAELEVLDGVATELERLDQLGFLRLVVTNQSAIARHLLGWDTLREIHAKLRDGAKDRIDAIYVCPHHPSEGHGLLNRVCPCRKPDSGMLRYAAAEHGVDLESSWIVGDAPRDIAAGQAVGVRGIVVLGSKIPSEASYPSDLPPPAAFVRSLREAVDIISSG